MPTLDPFKANGFDLISLTMAINKLPNMYGRIAELGLFTPTPTTTTTVMVEVKNGILVMVPSRDRKDAATKGRTGKRKVLNFEVPHIPIEDVVLPSEVQDIRSFGSESASDAFGRRVMEKLQDMRNNVDQTKEWMRVGALKGSIIDGDGTTELYDLYTEFNISKKTVDFDLGTASTNVEAKCREVTRHIEDNLMGERASSIHAFVSPEFFDKLVAHDEVRQTYINWSAAASLRQGGIQYGFPYCGITFEEYRGVVSNSAGSSIRFWDADYGTAFPLGTSSTFKEHNAPGNFNETVNTLGQPMYAKQEPRQFNQGWDIHVEANPLPMCGRPEICVEIMTST